MLCVTALQLQLHKEAIPIWSHAVPQGLAMNRFYHSQSHRGKKTPNVSFDAGVKSCCLRSSSSGWSSNQLRDGCHGTHRDGLSPFLGSRSPVFTGIIPRVKHPTLEQLPSGAAVGSAQ